MARRQRSSGRRGSKDPGAGRGRAETAKRGEQGYFVPGLVGGTRGRRGAGARDRIAIDKGPGWGGSGQGDLAGLELGASERQNDRERDSSPEWRTQNYQRDGRSDEALGARADQQEPPSGFDVEGYRESQRSGGPAYGRDPEASGMQYGGRPEPDADRQAARGEDDDPEGRLERGDFGSGRERHRQEREAMHHPGSKNVAPQLNESRRNPRRGK